MATINADSLNYQRPMAGEYGNVSSLTQTMTLSAADDGDKLVFARIPAGASLLDLSVVNTASSASTNMKFGYEYVDGSDSDDDYFTGAKSISSASRIRADEANAPVTTESEAYLTGTLGGANIATETTITVTLTYEFRNG